jgi:hypothetical protein
MAGALRRQDRLCSLVVRDARVVARPPIGASGGESLAAEPPAIVAIGVVVGAVDPDPDAIPEDPMAAVVVKVVVAIVIALRKATIPVAVIMAAVAIIEGLGVATTNVALWSRMIEVAARISGTAVDVAAMVGGATTVVGESARTTRAAA